MIKKSNFYSCLSNIVFLIFEIIDSFFRMNRCLKNGNFILAYLILPFLYTKSNIFFSQPLPNYYFFLLYSIEIDLKYKQGLFTLAFSLILFFKIPSHSQKHGQQ